jgi:hypothetical protein
LVRGLQRDGGFHRSLRPVQRRWSAAIGMRQPLPNERRLTLSTGGA